VSEKTPVRTTTKENEGKVSLNSEKNHTIYLKDNNKTSYITWLRSMAFQEQNKLLAVEMNFWR
jgi:hypothetical protein